MNLLPHQTSRVSEQAPEFVIEVKILRHSWKFCFFFFFFFFFTTPPLKNGWFKNVGTLEIFGKNTFLVTSDAFHGYVVL